MNRGASLIRGKSLRGHSTKQRGLNENMLSRRLTKNYSEPQVRSVKTKLECRSGFFLAVNETGVVQELFCLV